MVCLKEACLIRSEFLEFGLEKLSLMARDSLLIKD